MNPYATIKGRCGDYNQLNDKRLMYMPGAFRNWLAKGEQAPVLLDHLEDIVIGETIAFHSTKEGLNADIILFDTPAGRDAKRLIDVDILCGMSLGFSFSDALNPEDDFRQRVIHEVSRVDELSLVTQPSGEGCMIEGKGERKSNLLDRYYKRLERYREIKHQLETTTIKNHIYWKLNEAWDNYTDRLISGASMIIN